MYSGRNATRMSAAPRCVGKGSEGGLYCRAGGKSERASKRPHPCPRSFLRDTSCCTVPRVPRCAHRSRPAATELKTSRGGGRGGGRGGRGGRDDRGGRGGGRGGGAVPPARGGGSIPNAGFTVIKPKLDPKIEAEIREEAREKRRQEEELKDLQVRSFRYSVSKIERKRVTLTQVLCSAAYRLCLDGVYRLSLNSLLCSAAHRLCLYGVGQPRCRLRSRAGGAGREPGGRWRRWRRGRERRAICTPGAAVGAPRIQGGSGAGGGAERGHGGRDGGDGSSGAAHA